MREPDSPLIAKLNVLHVVEKVIPALTPTHGTHPVTGTVVVVVVLLVVVVVVVPSVEVVVVLVEVDVVGIVEVVVPVILVVVCSIVVVVVGTIVVVVELISHVRFTPFFFSPPSIITFLLTRPHCLLFNFTLYVPSTRPVKS